MYIDDRKMLYEIILSKGKGKRTKNLDNMLILISKNLSLKFINRYTNSIDFQSCCNQGLFRMLLYWKNFNEKKYTSPFSYFTEIFKRGIAEGYGELILWKKNSDCEPMNMVYFTDYEERFKDK